MISSTFILTKQFNKQKPEAASALHQRSAADHPSNVTRSINEGRNIRECRSIDEGQNIRECRSIDDVGQVSMCARMRLNVSIQYDPIIEK